MSNNNNADRPSKKRKFNEISGPDREEEELLFG
jgi:hypothetical protein